MKNQQPLPSGLEAALVTALEFIRIVVEEHPRTREAVLTAMDLANSGFDDEIDTLENLLASLSGDTERIVPRLTPPTQEE